MRSVFLVVILTDLYTNAKIMHKRFNLLAISIYIPLKDC